MPSRAARWISAIDVAVEEVRLAQARLPAGQLISTPRVVDVEVVELARRAVAAELGRVDVVDPGARRAARAARATCSSRSSFSTQSAPSAGDRAAHVDARLVDRVAERVAGVAAARRGAPRLRHERAHVADRAADDDVDALHRDAAARDGVAVHDEQAAVAGRAGRLAGVAVDDDRARHHVLGEARCPRCRARARSRACSCRRSSSRRGRRSRPRARRRGRRRRRARRSGWRRASGAAGSSPARSCRRWLSSRSGVAARSTTSTSAARRHDRLPAPRRRRRAGSGSHDARVVGAGQHRDRAVLGRHRDPVVGLGEHRRLAGDRVAQHREAVAPCRRRTCRSRRGRRGSPRAPPRRRRALAQPPRRGSRRRPRCRSRSGSAMPSRAQLSAQAVVVRERAVVHEAEVVAGRERVRALGRDPALGRHARVAERVRARARRRARTRSANARGPADLLVDLDHLAGAHHAQVGAVLLGARLRVGRRAGSDEERVAVRARRGRPSPPSRSADRAASPRARSGEYSDELAVPVRHRVAVDGDAGAVGPAIAHLAQHRGEVLAEAILDRRRLANRPTIPHMGARHPSVVGHGNLSGYAKAQATHRNQSFLCRKHPAADSRALARIRRSARRGSDAERQTARAPRTRLRISARRRGAR